MQQNRLSDDGPLADSIELPVVKIRSTARVSALSDTSVQKTVQLGTVDPPFLALLKHWAKPAVVVMSLFIAIQLTLPY